MFFKRRNKIRLAKVYEILSSASCRPLLEEAFHAVRRSLSIRSDLEFRHEESFRQFKIIVSEHKGCNLEIVDKDLDTVVVGIYFGRPQERFEIKLNLASDKKIYSVRAVIEKNESFMGLQALIASLSALEDFRLGKTSAFNAPNLSSSDFSLSDLPSASLSQDLMNALPNAPRKQIESIFSAIQKMLPDIEALGGFEMKYEFKRILSEDLPGAVKTLSSLESAEAEKLADDFTAMLLSLESKILSAQSSLSALKREAAKKKLTYLKEKYSEI